MNSTSATKTSQQPKGVATGEDGTVFVAEVGDIEAIDGKGSKSSVKTKPTDNLGFSPTCISSAKSLVAVGDDVSNLDLISAVTDM